MKKLIEIIKGIKFPLVTRKKLENALNNNAILNKNRVELSKQNVELQKELNKAKEDWKNEVERLQKDNKDLSSALKGFRNRIDTLEKENVELKEVNDDKTKDILHYENECNLLEKRVKEYEKIVNRAKKEVISKHCKKCGRFFRIASIDSYKKYCPSCEQKIKEERRNGRRK